MKQLTIQRSVLIAGVSLLLLTAGYCGMRVHELSQRQKEIKRDFSDINSIGYGLLDVSEWRDLVVRAVDHQIDSFQLTRAERDSLEKDIEGLLNALIDKADSIMRRPQKSLGGKIRQLAFKVFVKPTDLHKETPAFAHKIITEMMRPGNKRRLSYVAKSKLEDLGQQTYDSARDAEKRKFDSVFGRYGVHEKAAFNKVSALELSAIHHEMYGYVGGMVGSLLLLLLIWWGVRRRKELYIPLYILSIGMALIFLLTGLTSVMIELDARIDSIDFQLIGESISFKDQVIFFQSKSIVDVVVLLIRTGKYDSILVGVLILCFSIVFPIAKLSCTGFYLMGKGRWTKSRLVGYFAFHSGKWSMAATNRTELQPGYLVFVCFVLFGLVLSQLLQMVRPEPERVNAG